MTDPAPLEPTIRPASRALMSRVSVIWLVPVLALVVSLGIAWQSFSERGVLIEIAFENASGIVAEKTEVKFRDVHVGLVTGVRFSDDLSEVVASVRVERSVAPFLDADARFWVVRPEVSVRGISGLNTVLSGVFIEGTWDSTAGDALTRFQGLEKAPLTGANRGGTSITLRARDGNSIAAGAPILYKGIPVGVIESPLLADDGDGVVINAFIEAPYDRFVTTNTRFWDISGVSVSLGPGGVALNFSSLASLVEGGISFDTLVSGGDPLQPGAMFQLYASEADARDSLLVDTTTERLTVVAEFDGAVSGLDEGSDVRFRGVSAGEVIGISMVARDIDGRKVVRLVATLALRPDMLGVSGGASAEAGLDLLDDYVSQGLRAQLAKASLLSSDLIVDLVELPDAAPAALGMTDEGQTELPTVASEFGNLNATAEGLLARINALPIEEILFSVRNVLSGADRLINDDATRALAPELAATLAEARTSLAEIRQVLAELREAGAADSLNTALVSAAGAADAVSVAVTELPQLVARLDAIGVQTEAVLASAKVTLDGVGTLVNSEQTAAIVPTLTATLTDARTMLGETSKILAALTEADAVANLNAALASAAGAAGSVETAVATLPDLATRLNELATRTDAVMASAKTVLDGVGTVVNVDGAPEIIPQLTATLAAAETVLAETDLVLTELREAGATEQFNEVLTSASGAADAVESAALALPTLVASLDTLVGRAETVIGAYGDNSRLITGALGTLRDISEAADALRTLARTLQRNPNSILLGR